MKKIAILGSTGSIGTQTLDIIDRNRDKYEVIVLSCAKKIDVLEQQIDKYKPKMVVVEREEDGVYLTSKYRNLQVECGTQGLIEAVRTDCQIVVNSLMGIRGLIPTYYALEEGKEIAFANKETLVAGGELIMKKVVKKGGILLPVDSEHSAIFQCLQGNPKNKIRKLIITASGGPFRGYTKKQLENVTLEQALRHPKWSMGKKITIDSATLMNKGLEVIEARWLFDIQSNNIQVVVHPQSIIHSMVEYKDGAIIAQLGLPDMRVPISYALAYPDRLENDFSSLNFFEEAANLTFEKPDEENFKCLKMAKEVLEKGGSYPVVLNGANEALVQLFLERKIKFNDIPNTIEEMLNKHNPKYSLDLETILEIDREIKERVFKLKDI